MCFLASLHDTFWGSSHDASFKICSFWQWGSLQNADTFAVVLLWKQSYCRHRPWQGGNKRVSCLFLCLSEKKEQKVPTTAMRVHCIATRAHPYVWCLSRRRQVGVNPVFCSARGPTRGLKKVANSDASETKAARWRRSSRWTETTWRSKPFVVDKRLFTSRDSNLSRGEAADKRLGNWLQPNNERKNTSTVAEKLKPKTSLRRVWKEITLFYFLVWGGGVEASLLDLMT